MSTQSCWHSRAATSLSCKHNNFYVPRPKGEMRYIHTYILLCKTYYVKHTYVYVHTYSDTAVSSKHNLLVD